MRRSRAQEDSDEEERRAREERSRRVCEGARSHGVLQGGSGSIVNSDGRRSRAREDSGDIMVDKQGAREQQDCSAVWINASSAVEGSNSTESSQRIPHQSAVQCSFRRNPVSQHWKDTVTPESSGSNDCSSRSHHAVRPKCNRSLSFADQLNSDRQTDRRDSR